MEAVGRLLHLPDGDGVREIAIHIVPDLLRGPAHIQADAGHHSPGVDPGIGAPGADEVHRVTLETLQDGFQLALYRFFIRLVLPAEKAGAVVGQC